MIHLTKQDNKGHDRYMPYTDAVMKGKSVSIVNTDCFRLSLGLELADLVLAAALMGSDYTKQFLKLQVGLSNGV